MRGTPRLPRELEPEPLIQNGRLTQKLLSALGVHSKVVAPTLGNTVHPVVITEDLTDDTWFNDRGDDKACGVGGSITGAAGFLPVVTLWNPGIPAPFFQDLSRTLAIVDFATMAGAVTTEGWVYLGSTSSPAGTLTPAFFRDSRIAGSPILQHWVSTGDFGAPPAAFPLWAGRIGSNSAQLINLQVVLSPGAALQLVLPGAATNLSYSLHWRERPLQNNR